LFDECFGDEVGHILLVIVFLGLLFSFYSGIFAWVFGNVDVRSFSGLGIIIPFQNFLDKKVEVFQTWLNA
jgi:hypothetical protein